MDKQHRLGARHLKIPTKHSRDSKDRNTEIDSGSDYEYSWVEAEAEVDGRDEKNRSPRIDVGGFPAEKRKSDQYMRSPVGCDDAGQPDVMQKLSDSALRWRKMKIDRVYELVRTENKTIEEVATERFGSLSEFKKAERELKHQQSASGSEACPRTSRGKQLHSRYPRDYHVNRRADMEGRVNRDKSRNFDASEPREPNRGHLSPPVMTIDELNKLKSEVLRLELASKQGEALAAESRYNKEKSRYDAAIVSKARCEQRLSRRELVAQRHDSDKPKLAYDPELLDMVRDEKLSSRSRMDDEVASAITKDYQFSSDLEYVDEFADRMAAAKNHNTNKVMGNLLPKDCYFCLDDSRGRRKVKVVSFGTLAFLGMVNKQPIVRHSCVIVPFRHTFNTLECDENEWQEIKNFMKCLVMMFNSYNKSVIFIEQVPPVSKCAHSVIECIPIPTNMWETCPAYFKTAVESAEGAWTQNRPIIDTSKVGGIRGSMVKDLPYFHVWFEPNKGIGHIIEDYKKWPEYFGRSVIGGMLDIPESKWRNQVPISSEQLDDNLKRFKNIYDQFDWTKQLDDQAADS